MLARSRWNTGLLLAFLGWSLTPGLAQAHTQWMVSPTDITCYCHQPLTNFLAHASHDYPWVLPLGIVGFLAVIALDRLFSHHRVVAPGVLLRARPIAPVLLRCAMGLLLLRAGYAGYLFFPDLAAGSVVLRAVEFVTGAWLLSGWRLRLPLTAVGALFGYGIARHGAAMLDYMFLVGALAYLFAIKSEGTSGQDPRTWTAVATLLLQVTLGLSLLLPGLDKVLDPVPNMVVILKYGLNVPGVSHELFLYGAAWVESMLGLLALVGLAPRLIAISMLVLFANMTMVGLSIFHTVDEGFGHLPILACCATYLIEGPLPRILFQRLGAFRHRLRPP